MLSLPYCHTEKREREEEDRKQEKEGGRKRERKWNWVGKEIERNWEERWYMMKIRTLCKKKNSTKIIYLEPKRPSLPQTHAGWIIWRLESCSEELDLFILLWKDWNKKKKLINSMKTSEHGTIGCSFFLDMGRTRIELPLIAALPRTNGKIMQWRIRKGKMLFVKRSLKNYHFQSLIHQNNFDN